MEEQDVVFDFAVLGAGVEGSATAYNLVASNSKAAKVLLLEQVCEPEIVITTLEILSVARCCESKIMHT